jgi:hypothetical protein
MNNIQQPRRKFLQIGFVGFITTLFAGLPKMIFAQSNTGNTKGIVVHEDEGEHIITGRRKVPMTMKISKKQQGIDNISFSMENVSPGRKMRIHKHLNNDELIFIHKG